MLLFSSPNMVVQVNFITADWIPFGRAASARYKIHKWEPVFCHEEIILRTVFSPYFKRKAFPRDAKLLYAELAHVSCGCPYLFRWP
mmetsp:Transcript_20425/g.82452  ORF Transcript_20425/g.82452 Transcript_20425/m.82452 type:complete len:86 (+) Transcript_20425:1702-1959(+)